VGSGVAYPSAIFGGENKLALDGAHLNHEDGDGVQSQVRRGDPVPAAGSFERVFLGQLIETVIVKSLNGRDRFSNDKPGIRYSNPSSDIPGTYEHDLDTVKTVSAFAIYGKVDGYTNSIHSKWPMTNSIVWIP
jgi:hypothetical protein